MSSNNYEAIRGVDNYREPWVPEEAAFTWAEGIVEPGELYKVEFASALNPQTVEQAPGKVKTLLGLDDAAREDAESQPGFLHYFADQISEGKAKSFCLWATAEDARNASGRPAHIDAVKYALGEGKDVYEYYNITKTQIRKTEAGLYFTKLAFMAIVDGKPATQWKR